jgi:FkbM family methyltransferase
MAERRVFSKRYPGVSFVNYSQEALAEYRRQGFCSQFGQDYYLYNNIFYGYNSGGFFIDIGGNHPTTNNNSYFLETKGWTGLAFDPLERFRDAWISQRKATFHRIAISGKSAERNFIEILPKDGWEHTLSGFEDRVRAEDLAIYESKKYKIRTAPLREFLPRSQHVDLLLIDVEGAELEVLAGIDFTEIAPSYILIENDGEVGGSLALRCKMESFGYKLIARIGLTDDLFELVK